MTPLVCPHCGKPLPRRAPGNPHLAEARQLAVAANAAKAASFWDKMMPEIEAIRAGGITSLSGIARELKRRGLVGAQGGAWSAQSVKKHPRGWQAGRGGSTVVVKATGRRRARWRLTTVAQGRTNPEKRLTAGDLQLGWCVDSGQA